MIMPEASYKNFGSMICHCNFSCCVFEAVRITVIGGSLELLSFKEIGAAVRPILMQCRRCNSLCHPKGRWSFYFFFPQGFEDFPFGIGIQKTSEVWEGEQKTCKKY